VATANQLKQVVSASQFETDNTTVPAIFRRPGHLKAEAAKGRLNSRQAKLCCKSYCASDRGRHGIWPRKAAGKRTQPEGVVHVSAAAAVVVAAAAAQAGLHNGVRGQWNSI
jgi:hypothetical protein